MLDHQPRTGHKEDIPPGFGGLWFRLSLLYSTIPCQRIASEKKLDSLSSDISSVSKFKEDNEKWFPSSKVRRVKMKILTILR